MEKIGLIDIIEDGNEKIRTCIQCGSCTGSCIAADSMTISPRRLWRGIQLGLEDETMSSMSYWSCTTCGLCDKRCPRGIQLSQIMLSLRKKYDQSGGAIGNVSQIITNLSGSGNINGEDPKNRFLWLDNLMLTDQQRQKLFRKQSNAVYFTGCVGALFPQVGGIPQSLTRLLLKIETDFTLLDDEICCGYPLLAGGKGIDGIARYAEHNISAIAGKAAETVVVSCPTCYYMFAKIYPKLTGMPLPFQVMHYTEYLENLSGDGSVDKVTAVTHINPGGSVKDAVVTYHDPCDLGRKLHITEPPRKLLKGLKGVEFREMRFSGEESKCCGGGGNLEMANPGLTQNIAANRINDALEVGAEYLLSSCQQCKRTLQNAARKSRARIKVMDLTEFLAARLADES